MNELRLTRNLIVTYSYGFYILPQMYDKSAIRNKNLQPLKWAKSKKNLCGWLMFLPHHIIQSRRERYSANS